MGTQVHYKEFLPSYYSMRDLNEDSNSSSWPPSYGDKTLPNGQYCNGFTPRTITNAYPGYDKDILKQKMLEHEAIFRNQVVELHRLYRIQRDMMDEFKRKEMHKHSSSMEPSCSSSHLGSQVPSEDVRKWHIANFPLENSSYTRPSTSGTEIVNSPFSSAKGDGVQPGRVHMQNGYSSKASDVLEARPPKVRKKLFDLRLPADDYLDTEEGGQLRDNAGSLHRSYPANGDYVVAQESGTKLFLGGDGGAKGDSRKDVSTSNSCLRSSIGLADLNEPAQLDEATDPVDFLGYGNNHKETRSINASAKSNPPFVALPWKSNCASPKESLSNLYDRSRGKEREWFASSYETGNIKGSSASLPRGLEEDKIPAASHQEPVMLNKAYQAPGAHLVHHIKDGIWKDRTVHSLDMSHRNGEQSNYTAVGPFVTSKMASPYPCASSSEFSSSWPQSLSSWEKPNGSFTQRLSSLHTNSFFNSSAAVDKGSQSSQSQIGDYWHTNGSSSRLRPVCAGEIPIRSGFYHGSSSGTKESPIHVPSGAFDSLSYIKGGRFASERSSNNACENFIISSNNTDAKSAKGFNLNVLATSALSEELPRRDVEFGNVKREHQDPVTVLPWLKAKANGKNEGVNTRISGTSANSGFVQACSNPTFCQSDPSALEHHHMKTTKEVGETRHVRKILGVLILDIPVASRNELSSSPLVFASANLCSSPERETIRHERRSMAIDINVACDLSMLEPEEPDVVEQISTKKVMETKIMNIRNHFDLNSCITEDEEEPVSAITNKASVKTILDIDLEAPVLMDIEQDNLPGEDDDKQHEASSQHTQEELLKTVAEAIVAISSSIHCPAIEETHSDPSDDPLESLRWFVDVVSSCAAELDSTPSAREITGKNNNMMVAHSAFKEIDYFEAMTLQLTETKEEDYMPKPFVPEVRTVEDAGAASSLTNRPRRGNARRGRQRRDFQRDVLPGLASLSRHEVTEDIQIFGGLMRATGHTWNSSLTRNGTRNGGARGRRKKVVDTSTPVLTTTTMSSPLMYQLNNIEASLEDNKSLTGWGKTPRRPRRQRCPAGNPPPVLLT